MHMRTKVFIGAGVLAAGALLAPVGAQAQTEGSQTSTLDITKVVEGDVPPGTTFDVEINCDTTSDLTEGGPTTQTITFDETGGTQSVSVPQFNAVCSVMEIETGGADPVTYAPGEDGDGCDVSTTEVDAVIQYEGVGDTCGVIITNTFPEAEPDDVVPEPADVVDAQPAFTG